MKCTGSANPDTCKRISLYSLFSHCPGAHGGENCFCQVVLDSDPAARASYWSVSSDEWLQMSILYTGTFSERWGDAALCSVAAAIRWSPAAPAVAKVKRGACSGESVQRDFVRDANTGGARGNWLKVTSATSSFLPVFLFDSARSANLVGITFIWNATSWNSGSDLLSGLITQLGTCRLDSVWSAARV